MSEVADAKPVSSQEGLPSPKPGAPADGPRTSPVNHQASQSAANQARVAAEAPSPVSGDQVPKGPADNAQPSGPMDATPENVSLTPTTRTLGSTGNETVDQVLEFLGSSGLQDVDGILEEVSTAQELSLASKARLIKELGPELASMVIGNLDRAVQDQREAGEAEGKRLKEYALAQFGGTDPDGVWEGAKRFANSPASGLSADDKKVMNELLGKGGPQAEMVIRDIAQRYKKYSGYQNQGDLMEGNTGSTSMFSPLTREQYQKDIGRMVKEYGESSREVMALRQKRAQSIKMGY